MNEFNTADLCDEHELLIAQPIFKSFGANTHCHGQIKTVEAIEDNSYVKKLLQTDGTGYVMVIDGKSSNKCALVGDNLAALAVDNNWAGMIVNGCIRDSIEINKISISIKALNLVPNKSEKKDVGKYGMNICFAGITFKQDEYIYSDPDGIIVSKKKLL